MECVPASLFVSPGTSGDSTKLHLWLATLACASVHLWWLAFARLTAAESRHAPCIIYCRLLTVQRKAVYPQCLQQAGYHTKIYSWSRF